MAARSWMILAVFLALAGTSLADSRRLLAKKAKAPAESTVTVKDCAALKTAVDRFSQVALANKAKIAKMPKKLTTKSLAKYQAKVLAAAVKQTIVLDCAGKFTCTDPSAAEDKRDMTLKVMGYGQLTIKAADGCATGDARPRIGGGMDTYPTELIYAGVQNAKNAADKGGRTFLVLQNVVLDGAVMRDGATKPENLRGGGNFIRAAKVTLNNVDLVNLAGVSKYGGGALYAEDSPIEMTGGKIDGCRTPANGGAIWAETSLGGAAVTLKDVTVSNNVAQYGSGGAIAVTKTAAGAASVSVSGCKFTGNSAAKCGVLFSDRSDVATAITKSKANDAAGLPLSIDFSGNTVSDNKSDNGLTYCGTAAQPFAPAQVTGAAGASKPSKLYNDFAM